VSAPPIESAVLPLPLDPETSPSASSVVVVDASGRPIAVDSGPSPPTALRPDAALASDPLLHEDQPGVSVEMVFRPRHLPQAPRVPELAADGVAKAAKETAFTGSVDLIATGRMRWVFTSHAMPFPARSEIRARHDRYGHVLVWPSEGKYRVLAPGALRTALDEARVDVTPLSPGAKGATSSGFRLGERTRVVSLESSVGKIQLELGTFPDAGLGGPLFCRSLVELVAIDPSTSECRDDEVPLFASIEYVSGDGVDVEVTSLTKRTDIVPGEAVCPPPGAEYQPFGLPEVSNGAFLTKEQMSAFRSKPDLKVDAKTGAPTDGLVLENGSDRLLYFVVDGVPVVAVPAMSTRTVLGPLRGKYEGQWRTFLGDLVDAPTEIDVPGVVSTVKAPSQADAGR
jgi:hypothetical protein